MMKITRPSPFRAAFLIAVAKAGSTKSSSSVSDIASMGSSVMGCNGLKIALRAGDAIPIPIRKYGVNKMPWYEATMEEVSPNQLYELFQGHNSYIDGNRYIDGEINENEVNIIKIVEPFLEKWVLANLDQLNGDAKGEGHTSSIVGTDFEVRCGRGLKSGLVFRDRDVDHVLEFHIDKQDDAKYDESHVWDRQESKVGYELVRTLNVWTSFYDESATDFIKTKKQLYGLELDLASLSQILMENKDYRSTVRLDDHIMKELESAQGVSVELLDQDFDLSFLKDISQRAASKITGRKNESNMERLIPKVSNLIKSSESDYLKNSGEWSNNIDINNNDSKSGTKVVIFGATQIFHAATAGTSGEVRCAVYNKQRSSTPESRTPAKVQLQTDFARECKKAVEACKNWFLSLVKM